MATKQVMPCRPPIFIRPSEVSPDRCLYFKKDVSPELQNRPLYLSDKESLPSAQKCRIGPIVDREWWRGS
ncbi:hypothetical protein ARMGADRAFT_49043 [Armillaria gallica]|uniref:Uncharacterized protein n=1 Tax=Armillaria gallica TaxID=47427 RepID=A0A2H3EYA5_ARMGA|nr:hypothetical protein ARMGADRAFT_49043 [Armillaria gallica]